MRKEGKDGEETTNIREIKRIFEVFYSKLYLKKEVQDKEIYQYLENFDLEEPKEVRQILNAPISTEEIEKAIFKLKLNKAPGPDRFSAKFYKTLKNELSEFRVELMNEIIRAKELPQTWKEATTLLIPKEGTDLKDPKTIGAYRY